MCEPGAMADERVDAVVANNAAWCDAVCRTHGITGRFATDAWTSPVRTPPLFPDAVTLRPDAEPGSVLGRIDAGPGASVKDSFAALDLAPHGFSVLFDAEWIARAPGTGSLVGDALRYATVTAAGFPDWEAARRGDGPTDVLRSELLDDPAASLLAAVDRPTVAGAVLYATTDVVGVTNVFAPDDARDAAWRGIVAWTELHRPGVTSVGYESGADLAAASRIGFESLAPLRVWMRDP